MGVEARRAWNHFGRALVASLALSLAAGVAATAAGDPYWVFRRHPPWLAWTGGVNRLLDVDMRRGKALQLFMRPAKTVLIGSSTVYRGIDPSDLVDGAGYNLGLSSLMADELPAIADLLVARKVRRVVIGLDYFMFTNFPGPPRLKTGLDHRLARAEAWIKAALS